LSKNDKKDIKKGISFFQTITLLFIFVLIAIICLIVFSKQQNNKSLAVSAIVVTEDIKSIKPDTFDSQDLIGDFILHHEYFAADEEVLSYNNDNVKMLNVIEQKDLEIKTIETKKEALDNNNNKDIILNALEPVITPMIAIVVDDMGINIKRTLDIISINAPLTSSFLTYSKNITDLAEKAKLSGHEIMIHTPMEPKVPASLAPDTLRTNMNKEEIVRTVIQMLSKFENIQVSGINNHMGSKFTEDKERLGFVFDILKSKNMFFLDSMTTADSKGKELAIKHGIDFAQRDVFLDNKNDYDYILNQLKKTEQIAIKKGFAIAICHPKSQTFLALRDWVATLNDKNINLVHISTIVKSINTK